MNTYTGLKAVRSEKYNELFFKLGVFYAFSNSQLKEGMKANPLLEGEKYASIGGGGYVRNSNVDNLTNGMKQIDSWFKVANQVIKANAKAREDMICCELANYESWYTGDISTAFEVLKEQGITRAEISKVFKKYYNARTANL